MKKRAQSGAVTPIQKKSQRILKGLACLVLSGPRILVYDEGVLRTRTQGYAKTSKKKLRGKYQKDIAKKAVSNPWVPISWHGNPRNMLETLSKTGDNPGGIGNRAGKRGTAKAPFAPGIVKGVRVR